MGQIAAIEPRLLNQAEAARYCGYGTRTFKKMVSEGKLPPAVMVLGDRWDRRQLDKHIDRLNGAVAQSGREEEALAKF